MVLTEKPLSEINAHPRDKNITFKEENHEYTIKGMKEKPMSVTTVIHSYFPKFDADKIIKKMMNSPNWKKSKYYGMKRKEIKSKWEADGSSAAALGTAMHATIESFLNGKKVSKKKRTKEFKLFMNFYNDYMTKYKHRKTHRSEWLIYDEDVGIAGSIDYVVKRRNGKLDLLDWKRSKQIKRSSYFGHGFGPFEEFDDCNYAHYCLQLNFYRHILETKYGEKVGNMILVILHPDQTEYQYIVVPRLDLSEVWPDIVKEARAPRGA